MGDGCDVYTHFSTSFTKVYHPIYGSGFKEITTPTLGQCLYIRRYGKVDGSSTDATYNAMSMKAYETPNLLG